MDFQITLVLGGDAHAELCVTVKEFCEAHRITFSARRFNSGKYEHDAVMVSSLPCFYISKRKSPLPYSVFYPETVLDELKKEFMRCKAVHEERVRKAAERKASWTRTIQWIKGLGTNAKITPAPSSH